MRQEARWHDGSELPEGEIRCLCKCGVAGEFRYYKVLVSRPYSSMFKWFGDYCSLDEAYTQEEILCWCPLDEIDAALTANRESFSQ